MLDPRYEAQVRLLIDCLPEVARQECFALKGGTAINLFVRDLPRVSVDIDLTYLPLKPRDEALAEISSALGAVKADVERRVRGSTVHAVGDDGRVVRLRVATEQAEIQIEPNLVLRGCVAGSEDRVLVPTAQANFQASVRVRTLSLPDLYGGKLCAALDRQHPRDLFDVKILLDDTGITPDIRRAFVVYLASHPRPMAELLCPHLIDIADPYGRQFAGMARVPVTLQELEAARAKMVTVLRPALDENERRFLLSMKRGEPDWKCLGIDGLDRMPALLWKLHNIRRMDPQRRLEATERLRELLAT